VRKFLIAIGVIVLLLAGIGWYFSAADIPRAMLEAKYATPPSQFTEVAYGTDPKPTRVHYRIRGPVRAPVLLLLHGSNATLFTWEPWAARLSNTWRIVSVDLPAHGLTGPTANHDYSMEGMVSFVDAFANKIGLAKFALAGNSMGGGVAARYAEEHPDRVSALILVDAGGMPSKRGDGVPLAFQLLRYGWAQSLLAHLDPTPLAREGLNKAIVTPGVVTDKMVRLYSDMALLEGERQATFERFNQGGDRTAVKDNVGKLTMPVLILWGEQDHLIPVEAAHTWNKAVPGSKLIIYKATGHIPMEERPDESANDVRAFLSAHPG